MPPPRATRYFAVGGFTCSECKRQYNDESPAKPTPAYNEWPELKGARICDDCLPGVMKAHPGKSDPPNLPHPSGPMGPLAAGPAGMREESEERVSGEPDRARVVRRSAYGRVEVELASSGRPGEAPEALLERVRGLVRQQYEDEVLEAQKEEAATRG